ncbi:MAG TPA: SUMF1/EgtB/PvdO family nonheme iron enzyme [Blastocatellia bacterium]|nr:SUMF1/EgtB/PvdO family nonheme iron enzyme [Blastocatellia bacterium]
MAIAAAAQTASSTAAGKQTPAVSQPQVTPQFDLDHYQFVLLRRGPNWAAERTPETERIQEGHMAHIHRMAEAGKLLAAGPMGDDGELRGIFIFRAASIDEVNALAAADPAVKAGRLKIEALSWSGPKGIGAKYAERIRQNPGGKGTMTKYHLVLLRRGPKASGESTPEAGQVLTAHLWHIRRMMDSGRMPLAGPFDGDGELRGVFVIATDSIEEAKAIAQADPAVKAGRLEPEIHPWYSEREVMPSDVGAFVKILAGEFLMGSANGGDNEKPAHRVKISRGFEIGKYEVTQQEWEALMGSNPSRFKGADLPVEQVSWEDVQHFIRAMNARNDGYVYRLPIEAEWEYAARAGTTGDYGGTGNLSEMGWYSENSGGKTHPVGEKRANAWGLYDMHGNVWEWCQDWYDKEYYKSSPATDPQGPGAGTRRATRGGCYSYTADRATSSSRAHPAPDARYEIIGFRLVRTPK